YTSRITSNHDVIRMSIDIEHVFTPQCDLRYTWNDRDSRSSTVCLRLRGEIISSD
ncbi:MAG: hypothetical protein LQ349_006741, partial [Xanthoria aureola]